MKKTIIQIVTALFTIVLATTSFAGKGEGKGAKGPHGKVSAVADGSITLTSKSQGDQTFKTTSDTKVVKADQSAGTLSDIKVGSLVKITVGGTPDTAAEVTLVERKKKNAEASGTSSQQ